MASGDQRALVTRMVAEGAVQAAIAAAVGISVPTLRKAFAAELADRLAAGSLFDHASAPVARRSRPRRKPAGGRPPYEPTREDRRRVDLLIATGTPHVEIARVLGLSEPTLRQHFADELATGAARKRAETLARLDAAAGKGNVTAVRALLDMMDRAAVAALDSEFRSHAQRDGAEKQADRPVGKKIQSGLDAVATVERDTEWAHLLRPH